MKLPTRRSPLSSATSRSWFVRRRCFSAFCTVTMRRSRVNGFMMKSNAPRRMAETARLTELSAVMITTSQRSIEPFDALEHVKSVHIRKVDVEHEHRGGFALETFERLTPGVRDVYFQALVAKVRGVVFRKRGNVLDDQNSQHAHSRDRPQGGKAGSLACSPVTGKLNLKASALKLDFVAGTDPYARVAETVKSSLRLDHDWRQPMFFGCVLEFARLFARSLRSCSPERATRRRLF